MHKYKIMKCTGHCTVYPKELTNLKNIHVQVHPHGTIVVQQTMN